jgi:hypothetical protein
MSQTINRMYDSLERANQAADELKNNRFDRFDDVYVVGGGAGASTDDIVARLMQAFVLKAHAKVFAERIKRGGALVTVHAAFGTAVAAIEILDRHGPVDSGVVETSEPVMAWDDAAPCSSLMHMPVLLADSATFSKFWNVRPLAKHGATTGSALGLPEVSKSSGPFTGTFGMALISKKPTILSSMLGMPLLTKPKPARR